MDLSGDMMVVQSQSPGDSFSFNEQQFTTDADGLASVPVECLALIQSFGFVLTDKQIAVADPAPASKK